MNEKEKAVLFALSENPEMLEKVTIKPGLFTGRSQEIFTEILRQFNESQSFSYDIAADKLKMKISELHRLYEGCYHFKEDRLTFTLKEIEREVLNKKIASLLKKETDSQIKTGTIDEAAMARIRHVFYEIDLLDSTNEQFFDYSEIEAEEIAWLWPGRIPLGMITIIAGNPGVGKSFFTTWLAAKLSRGGTLPGPSPKKKLKPCGSILISGEDLPRQLIKPRLMANTADDSKIIGFSEPMRFSLDTIGGLDRKLEKNPGIRMVVIDPLNAFLGTKLDYFRDPDVRQKLQPLNRLAEDRNIAVLGVAHLNKKEDSEIITRIGGSIAFAGAPRSVLAISYDVRDTEKRDPDVRLFASVKMNLARKPQTIAFKINDSLRIDFDDRPIDLDAETIFSRETREQGQRSLFGESWLLSYLEQHLEGTSKEIRKAAEQDGIPSTTLYRARAKLESQKLIETLETGFGKDKKSVWSLIPRGSDFQRQ